MFCSDYSMGNKLKKEQGLIFFILNCSYMYLLVCASTCEEVQYFSLKKLLSGISKNFLFFMQSSHDFCNLMLTSANLNDLK